MTQPSDRLAQDLRALIEETDPDRDYRGHWEYIVQKTDGKTVDARATDPRMPDIVGCPLYSGLPGATVKPSVGTTCLVVFANADPTKPRVVAFDRPAMQSVTVDGGTGTAEHVLTTEAFANLLLIAAPLIGPGVNTITSDAALAAVFAAAASGPVGPLTLTAIDAALALKVTAGGDGTPGGSAPSVGCPNLRGG